MLRFTSQVFVPDDQEIHGITLLLFFDYKLSVSKGISFIVITGTVFRIKTRSNVYSVVPFFTTFELWGVNLKIFNCQLSCVRLSLYLPTTQLPNYLRSLEHSSNTVIADLASLTLKSHYLM